MTALGQGRKSDDAIATSALHPTTDIPASGCDVRKVPIADSCTATEFLFDNLVGDGEEVRPRQLALARFIKPLGRTCHLGTSRMLTD